MMMRPHHHPPLRLSLSRLSLRQKDQVEATGVTDGRRTSLRLLQRLPHKRKLRLRHKHRRRHSLYGKSRKILLQMAKSRLDHMAITFR
jgi:hypothetical protein